MSSADDVDFGTVVANAWAIMSPIPVAPPVTMHVQLLTLKSLFIVNDSLTDIWDVSGCRIGRKTLCGR